MKPNALNRQWVLVSRPTGEPDETNFELRESPVAQPGADELLVRTLWLSMDPYMRGRMRDAPSYVPPVGLGEVMSGGVVGEVVASNARDYKEGDIVEGYLGWQTLAVVGAESVRKVDPSIAPISTALGVLGMPGMTAYFGLLEVGEPKSGDTVVVSAASGAVGSLVGQIAKIRGCRVVGIAGSDKKCAYIRDQLGFDAAVNYKTGDLDAALKDACSDGIDVYFDNVGGRILDTVLQQINLHARIVICGMIAEYNLEKPELAPRPTRYLLVKRARMQGLIVFDWRDRYAEATKQMASWLAQGKLKYAEDVVKGFENAPRALLRLFRGENFGKQLVEVAAR